MKKVFILFFVFILNYSFGQQRMYVGLHYVTVKNEDAQAHIDSEKNYFSKRHKAAIDNGNKIGWDMWRLENPNYREPHTTFVYAHLENPDNEPNMQGSNNMFSESEINMVRKKWTDRVVKSGYVMTSYKGGFVPAANQDPPKFAVLDWMMVDPIDFYEYEQTELKTFLPMQKSNKIVKGWGLHKVVSPSNNNLEASNYVVARFFDSMSDIYNMMDQTNPLSKNMKATMKNIMDLRKIKRSQVLSLVLSER
tara:strand:- start:329 stop:1078 length:750 start_codon:yes stop_codon:yes gene_type:complete